MFGRQHFGELVHIGFDEALELEHHARAALRIDRGPRGLRRLRGGDRLVEQRRVAQSDLGLHAAIFTGDLDVAMRAVRELDFGGVVVNDVPTVRVDQQPYGGVRDAGNTREGPAHTVREMTELRFVSLPFG